MLQKVKDFCQDNDKNDKQIYLVILHYKYAKEKKKNLKIFKERRKKSCYPVISLSLHYFYLWSSVSTEIFDWGFLVPLDK